MKQPPNSSQDIYRPPLHSLRQSDFTCCGDFGDGRALRDSTGKAGFAASASGEQDKTIRSSLAIEGNMLTESQVSDLLDGKRVVAPVRQIQEVKNAIATYDLIAEMNPFDINDLLRAHKTMMNALDDRPGRFRQGGVGVFAGDHCIHMAPPADPILST